MAVGIGAIGATAQAFDALSGADAEIAQECCVSHPGGGCCRDDAPVAPDAAKAALAVELLDYAKESLIVDLRFLEPAISFLECRPCEGGLFATDGAALYYDAAQVVSAFAEEPARLARDVLHMTLHCLFRHPFSHASFRPALWDLACDMAVESCISDLGLQSLACLRESRQAGACTRFFGEVAFVSAETLYGLFCEKGIDDREAADIRRTFFADDHAFWSRGTAAGERAPMRVAENAADPGGANDADAVPDLPVSHSADDAADDADEPSAVSGPDAAPAPDFVDDALASAMLAQLAAARVEGADAGGACFGAGGIPSPDIAASGMPEPQQRTRPLPSDTFNKVMQTRWREMSLRADVALDDFSQLWGAIGGDFSLALKRANVERVDYGEFLRRFVSRDEQLMVNDEEFDYIYYCYGLAAYGNMPLIEPLEYADDGRIREFVIAIDTSASTKGDMVASFVERTCDILEDAGVFSDALDLYVILCDARVQDIARIRTRADVRAWADSLELKGLGGTDFRPVFSYVDELIDAGELAHLKGLLYFTDGQGAYPKEKPRYETAFVLTDEAYVEEPDVPPWAMRVSIDSGEFRTGDKEGAR